MSRRVIALVALGLAATAVSSALSVGAAAAQTGDELYGGRVPLQVLIDNDKVRVNLISFPLGYRRTQHFSRRSDQIVVYLDDGQFERPVQPGAQASDAAAHAGQPVVCGKITEDCGPVGPDGHYTAAAGPYPRGSVSWVPQGSDAAPLRITRAYRALYIELKRGEMTAPDAAAAKLPAEPVVGGGAPARVLIDNDKMRATLISFPEGFIRPGGFHRRLDTLIAYIDDAKLELPGPAQRQYAVIRALNHPHGPAVCDPIKDCDSVGPDGNWVSGDVLLRGTVAWHPQDGFVNKLRIAHGYRALYIELKR